MTTITIERKLLEQAVESFVGYRREMRLMLGDEESEPCDVEKAIRAALTAAATSPEPVAWMSPKRFYRTRAMALTNGEQLVEPLYLRLPATAPATAPAWQDAPTCAGLWLCDEGDENPYRFTCHDISMPLSPYLVGESERWYGPIPPDGDKP